MRVYSKVVVKDGSGTISMEAEYPEDFWHVFNILEVGDLVSSKSFRKVQVNTSNVGSVGTKRVKVFVTVDVEKIDFDSGSCLIRLHGRNRRENKHVPLGSYHPIELALNRKFSIEKKKWDAMHLERVALASNPDKSAELAVVVMQQGLAHVLLITEHMTICKAKVEVNIPKKRVGSATRHSKGIVRFYKNLADQVAKNVDFSIVKCCVLASPAFVAADFRTFLIKWAMQQENKNILDNKSKFILGHTSSGHQQALKEVLSNSELMSKIGDTKCARDIKALEKFYKLLNECPEKAFYGVKQIQMAIEACAIDTFMITDELFRCSNHIERQKFVTMVENVREYGSEVLIFSSQHASGQQLKELTGVAAILRFPMHDILEEEDDEDSDSEKRVE